MSLSCVYCPAAAGPVSPVAPVAPVSEVASGAQQVRADMQIREQLRFDQDLASTQATVSDYHNTLERQSQVRL